MMIPALLFIGIFIYYPLVKGVQMAFQNYNLFNLNDIHYIGLENFKKIVTADAFDSPRNY